MADSPQPVAPGTRVPAASVAGPTFIAFSEGRLVARGTLREIAITLALQPPHVRGSVLIFDAVTSEPADIDFEGTVQDILERTDVREAQREATERRARGRPRLGVVAREITLLPRHWEWLNEQPGGASVALRRLVDGARRTSTERDSVRRAQEATYRFMAATLGDAPGFEEAIRSLFHGDADRFAARTAGWPEDLRAHVEALARPAFREGTADGSLPDATGG